MVRSTLLRLCPGRCPREVEGRESLPLYISQADYSGMLLAAAFLLVQTSTITSIIDWIAFTPTWSESLRVRCLSREHVTFFAEHCSASL
jgi:hypothetical protein